MAGSPPRRLGLGSATLTVVASMIGTGVFTTTGVLLEAHLTPEAVLWAWALGGGLALCGALAYGRLGAAITANGGEYRFLSDLYHPAVGVSAGWVSLVVGFSAPAAASALAFGAYLHELLPALGPKVAGTLLLLALSALHARGVRSGVQVQNALTLAKAGLITLFVIAGALALPDPPAAPWASDPAPAATAALASPEFAVGLILVSFAYSGWNGAAYLAGEVREARRAIPVALALGTTFVCVLYLGLNAVFVAAVPVRKLVGVVDVGHVVASHLFGSTAAALLTGLIALALASSVSALTLMGPRVYEAMGEDYRALRFLRSRTPEGGPLPAILLQGALSLLLLWTQSFGALLTYVGVTLSLFATLTVLAVFRLDARHPPAASGPPSPLGRWVRIPALLFALFSAWIVLHTLWARPREALIVGLTLAAGLVLYRLVRGTAVPRPTPLPKGSAACESTHLPSPSSSPSS